MNDIYTGNSSPYIFVRCVLLYSFEKAQVKKLIDSHMSSSFCDAADGSNFLNGDVYSVCVELFSEHRENAENLECLIAQIPVAYDAVIDGCGVSVISLVIENNGGRHIAVVVMFFLLSLDDTDVVFLEESLSDCDIVFIFESQDEEDEPLFSHEIDGFFPSFF